MNDKELNKQPVTEDDYDLFYGFVDSVFEEKKQFEDDSNEPKQEVPLAVTESEWTPEPFEEFIVGMPSQDEDKYYTLNIVSPNQAKALPGDIHPNHYGTISGIVLSLTACAAFLFTVYFLTSEAEPEVVSNSHLNNIEQSLSAVESQVQSVHALESQIQAMAAQLHQLNGAMTTKEDEKESQLQAVVSQLHQLNGTISTKQKKEEVAAVVNGAWVVNLASFHSEERAQLLLAEVESIDIPVESFTTIVNGKQWIRIRLIGFKSRLEAKMAMSELSRFLPDNSAWVGRR